MIRLYNEFIKAGIKQLCDLKLLLQYVKVFGKIIKYRLKNFNYIYVSNSFRVYS